MKTGGSGVAGVGGGGGGDCFPGQLPGENDSGYVERVNPPPSGEGANYGNGAAPIRFSALCMNAMGGADARYDLSFTKNTGGGIYVDSENGRFDERGLKI